MAKAKTIRFGVIGPGGMGRNRVFSLNKDKAVDVVAATDTSADCLDKLEEGLGHKVARFKGPNGYQKMIDSCELDAVGVFSPHTLHYDHTMYALEHNLHVMIEKPMVCGVKNAIAVAKLAAKKKLVFLLTYQRHFEAKYVTARRLIQKGTIGDVTGFYVYMAQDWRGNGWRGSPKYSGGGQLNDSGSHYQDILLYMTGAMPKSVQGSYDFLYHGARRPIEINGSYSVELTNGAAGRLIIIGDYIKGFSDDVRIQGTKGILTMGMGSPGLTLHQPGKDPKAVPLTVPRGYPSDPGDNFAKLVTGRTTANHVPALFGAQVALLTDAMLAAGKTGRKANCATLLKRAGYSYKDITIK
ncbi:MAG: Gfo/Idh/MocA family oxidoreductase [Candidatus Brocadiae bacterium]|nr:Gfo/Idh/MocA family oxidoreductase [Candidatus Brocadiia bacterium]